MMKTSLADKLSSRWLRLRRRLALFLSRFADEPAAGTITPFERKFIDDGIDYSLPLALPQSLMGDEEMRLYAAADNNGLDSEGKRTLLENADIIKRARESHLKSFSDQQKNIYRINEADSVYHFQFDKPYLYYENLSQFPTSDPLREWDWQGGFGLGSTGLRRDILSRSHLAFERNPIANTAVTLTTQFCIGKGLTVTYKNKEVERILEEFRSNKDNGIEVYEKTFLNDLQVDGELFIRFIVGEDGQCVIYPLKPWEVWWIKRDRLISRRYKSFHWVAGVTNGVPGDYNLQIEDIAADQILFIAINHASYEVRGRPELFRILPWLKAYKDWLEGRARQNHWRGAVLWDVSLEGATPGQVSAKRNQYRQPPPPGSLTIHNDKEVWSAVESKSNAADVAEDGRQIKLMGAVGKKLPEYMLGDGENANKATANAQQLPALRSFGDFQDIMVNQVWEPIYKRVIENAIESGLLPAEVEEQDSDGDPITDDKGETRKVKTIEAFSVSAPELEETDPKNLADALTLAKNNSWVSDETASGRMGFDYRAERKKIDRELRTKVERAYQGVGDDVPTQPTALQDFLTQDKEEDDGKKTSSSNGRSKEPAAKS